MMRTEKKTTNLQTASHQKNRHGGLFLFNRTEKNQPIDRDVSNLSICHINYRFCKTNYIEMII